MNNVFGNLKDVIFFRDDLITHGSDKGAPCQRFIVSLHCLIGKNILSSPNKFLVRVSSFKCLGYVINNKGSRLHMRRPVPFTNALCQQNLTEPI